jgi:hypothetical protein
MTKSKPSGLTFGGLPLESYRPTERAFLREHFRRELRRRRQAVVALLEEMTYAAGPTLFLRVTRIRHMSYTTFVVCHKSNIPFFPGVFRTCRPVFPLPRGDECGTLHLTFNGGYADEVC